MTIKAYIREKKEEKEKRERKKTTTLKIYKRCSLFLLAATGKKGFSPPFTTNKAYLT